MSRRRLIILACVIAAAALSLLVAGCGAGGPSSTATATTTTQNGAVGEALAFARCMRSHGVPNWPDPTGSGGFDKSKLQQLGISPSQIRRIEERACNLPLGGRSQTQTITAADRTDYLKAAACMRSHGFPGFPDPTFENDNVQTNIPSSVDQDSSQFKGAAATCTKLIPAGLPYSSANAP